MKKLFLLLVAMLAVLATGGCRLVDFHEFSISGRVVDADGKPISGVTVKVSEDNTEAVTAANGTFAFNKMALGMKTLTCSHTAYWIQQEYVEVRHLYNVQVEIVMQRIADEGPDPEPDPDPELDPVLEALAESMVFVEGGTFQMGATSEQGSDVQDDEKPVHSVTLSDFYIGKYEVTQAQWKAVMGENPSYFTGDDNLPVEQVSWEDVQEFIQKLNALTGKTYRLPTEAEWEYAARGGKKSQGYKYAGSNTVRDVAWYEDNSGKTHLVGQKQPNELGLYDMSGNVMEWCRDWYGDYSSSAQTNPTGPSSGLIRPLRGGSWCANAGECRVANRIDYYPAYRYFNYGFRLVEGELPQQEDPEPDPEVDPLEALAESMVFVEGGTFQMGATSEQGSDVQDDEKPVHSVTLSDFYMGKYEVTQEQWKAVMGSNPSYFTGEDNLPVEQVSWEDVQEFIQKLNAKTGKTYRLPTEAEWEYAARGGNQSQGYKYAGSNKVGDVAWYEDYSGGKTHPVGQKQPNELGLYDMSGNVEEWCQDWYGDYSSSAQTNPTGPSSGLGRVLRGGGWSSLARHCRVACRNGYDPSSGNYDYGFRLVEGELPLQEDPEVDPLEALAESMVFVEGGTFQMGATSEQGSDALPDEKPVHFVTLSDFYIGKYEVTQAQWKAVMGENPNSFTGEDNLPVEQVSWEDVQEFIQKLNTLTGKMYRLPTEAEWEYAARGGSHSQGYKYSGSNTLALVAWYGDNSGSKTHPVGKKRPNELGLYDMSGNVYEWCQDWYGAYGSSAQTNPTGPASGSYRVLRGGSWFDSAQSCRVAERRGDNPSDRYGNYGFRLVEGELPPQEDPEVDPLEALAKSMVLVEGGTFQMGATSEQGSDALPDEKPVHSVTLSDFYIGKYEVTQAQWKAVMGEDPTPNTNSNNYPRSASWDDIQTFITKLNEITGKTYRLPTEAEWEYAARGGNQSLGYKYAGSNTIDEVAWYYGNSGDQTHPVGQMQPNELGLYDMSGNVMEWCQDWYAEYTSASITNPRGAETGTKRIIRGGYYISDVGYCRISARASLMPTDARDGHGFRLVEGELPPQEDPEVDPLEALAESMVFVEGGTFQMGATSEQGSDALPDEKPVHSVTLSDFYIGKYEVTQAQWKAVMGSNPSYFTGDDNRPVECVSWEDVQEFIQKLNTLTGKTYRLPTEAEWEYAARGGNQSQGYKYAGSNTVGDVAWYWDNSGEQTHLVGQKQPNELGLYDMSGNVWEWCQDWHGDYTSSAQTNPTGPSSGSFRVLRGGSWLIGFASEWRVADRGYSYPSSRSSNYGFRLVEGELPLQEDPEEDPLEALVESMVFVEGGTFQMGATSEQGSDAFDGEKPDHSVTLSDFYIGKYEVTQAQWKAVMGENPSSFTGQDNLPVEEVSWEDVQEFIQTLNALTGKTYRLPTEAEWEYAARGGNQSQGYKYAGSNSIDKVAWYDPNSDNKTHPVGQKQPNELGLYDMSGNVWEWCQDWNGDYSSSAQTNPTGPSSGSNRVLRGGSWFDDARSCRVANRGSLDPSTRYFNFGFRLVEGELPPTGSEEEGGEEDDTVYPFEATYSAANYDAQNYIYLEQQGTVNGKRVTLQFQMYDADDTIVEYYEANVFAPGVYTIGSDYTGMDIWADYSQVSIDGGPMEMPESGTLTVTHVDGKYNLLYDFKTASATIKAEYTGSLTGMKDPSEMGGGEEGGVLNVNFTSASASRKLKLQATYEGDISGMIVPK